MNRENILKVADAIAQHSIPNLGFNMAWIYAEANLYNPDQSGTNCGTTACIAGWAYAVEHGGRIPDLPEEVEIKAADAASKFMGLPPRKSDDLFYPFGHKERLAIEPSQAVAVLRHLAETGEVDWSIA